ncbi:hypothetical protein [Microbulbifer elongatus]|uniref:hypothetical protein n=1 Tax=Microbulbifer elongatus TaxID=86173 RepID=UPI001CFEFA74|nr:hypothetical protein [Microbulbifer elongatus]
MKFNKVERGIFVFIFFVLVSLGSINWAREGNQFLDDLSKLDYRDFNQVSIEINGNKKILNPMRYEEVAQCLGGVKKRLVRTGGLTAEFDVLFRDGGSLRLNLILFHEQEVAVLGNQGINYDRPKLGVYYKDPSFNGISYCMYSIIASEFKS